MVQATEETQVFPAGKTGIKTKVRPGMITELAPYRGGVTNSIETGDTDGATRGNEERCQDAKKGSLAGTVRAQQGHGIARFDLERNASKGWNRRCGKWLNKSAPAAVGGRERFFERVDCDGCVEHYRGYSVSAKRKQSVAGVSKAKCVATRGNPR